MCASWRLGGLGTRGAQPVVICYMRGKLFCRDSWDERASLLATCGAKFLGAWSSRFPKKIDLKRLAIQERQDQPFR